MLFARLIEEAHKRGIRVLVDGVFNHCGSFNKWLDAELLYQHAGGYPQGAYVSEDSPYRYFFSSTMKMPGRLMTATTAGGDTRRFRSSITRNRWNCTSTFWGLRKNGCRRRLEQMAGGWMWRQIWGGVPG